MDLDAWTGLHSTRPEVWRQQGDPNAYFWCWSQLVNDPALTVRFRVEPTFAGAPAVTAVMFERDGGPVTARDLRSAPIGALLTQARYLSGWTPPIRPSVERPGRPGPPGHGREHWERIYDLSVEAERIAPRTPIKWMRNQFDPPVADSTMRRWRDEAVRLHEPRDVPEWAQERNVGAEKPTRSPRRKGSTDGSTK